MLLPQRHKLGVSLENSKTTQENLYQNLLKLIKNSKSQERI